jgi:hypothetical protein
MENLKVTSSADTFDDDYESMLDELKSFVSDLMDDMECEVDNLEELVEQFFLEVLKPNLKKVAPVLDIRKAIIRGLMAKSFMTNLMKGDRAQHDKEFVRCEVQMELAFALKFSEEVATACELKEHENIVNSLNTVITFFEDWRKPTLKLKN